MAHKTIQFLKVFPLRGPSIWTYRPILEAWIDIGDLEDCPSNTIPGFVDRLGEWLPTLNEHRCSYGEEGGFMKRLREGTWPAHILEHVTIELQYLAGIPGGFGKAREAGPRGIYKVVISAPFEEVSRASLEAGRDLVMAAIEDRPFDVLATVGRLREMAAHFLPGPSAACIVAAAAADKERRIPVVFLPSRNLVQLGYGANQRRIWAADTERTGAIAQGIAQEPELTHRLLKSCGLPVPSRSVVTDTTEAWEEAEDLGVPVYVKADSHGPGELGRKVSTREEMDAACLNVTGNGGKIVVEKCVPGSLHRLLVVSETLVAAAPLNGGSETEADVTAEIHPETARAACLAAKIVGLDVSGIDVVLEDVTRPLSATHGAITAVHAGRGLIRHLRADSPESRRIGRSVIAGLFPNGRDGRIPVVGVIGSIGCTRVARLVAELLRLSGKMTGLACGDGTFFNRRQVDERNSVNWESGRRILMNRSMEAAVLESSAEMILGEGLPYDRCQVAVVTSIIPRKHFGEFFVDSRERVFQAMRTQVDVVLPGGVAVLNAADAMAVEMEPLCDGEVIYYAADPSLDVVKQHLAKGGRAVVVRAGDLFLAKAAAEKETETEIAPLSAIPLIQGDDESLKLASVLASVAAAWALDIPLHVIRTGVETYSDAIFDHNQPELPFFDASVVRA